MASAEKGKYVVLFTSGNFIFFKHKNDKGIYCPKSILNSSRQVLKDDIYELSCESVTQRDHKLHPDMPEAAVLMATKAKFVKTPRVIQGVGTMKKISQDGEYGFIEYQDNAIGKTPITAFCTRITVKPAIDKGAMHKFFTAGGKVRFVAKEQPPSGMFNIEWRVVTATDMKHEISEANHEKVTPCSAVPVAARPVSVAATVAAAMAPPARPPSAGQPTAAATVPPTVTPPPGLPPVPATNGGVSASSSSSSVANGISYAARASQQLPEKIALAVQMANSGAPGSLQLSDESLPSTCPDPSFFRLTDDEKQDLLLTDNFALKENESPDAIANNIYGCWPHYKKGINRWASYYEEERSLDAFEAELSQLSRVATALYGGDAHVCPVHFASRVT